jgi:hypothetical protein
MASSYSIELSWSASCTFSLRANVSCQDFKRTTTRSRFPSEQQQQQQPAQGFRQNSNNNNNPLKVSVRT